MPKKMTKRTTTKGRSRDTLVVASKVKAYIKSKKMNTSADAIGRPSAQHPASGTQVTSGDGPLAFCSSALSCSMVIVWITSSSPPSVRTSGESQAGQ